MPRKEFEAFTRLDASDVNTFLMDQSVMSFAGTAARGSAIPTPVEGMVAYLNDSNTLSIYDGAAWGNSLSPTGGVLQVIGNSTNTSVSVSSGTFADSGLTATITPKFASSKIMVLISQKIETTSTSNDRAIGATRTLRGATVIGDPGSYNSSVLVDTASAGFFSHTVPYVFNFLDSPATTSAVTYKTQIATVTANTVAAQASSGTSSIVLLEIGA